MGIEEALAAGVPVVTSNRCGMPHLVAHGESGLLVDPTRTDDIAAHLARVLQDEALRAEMGRRGRSSARERFHPEAIARRTLDVYREAIEGSRARGR